MDKIKQNLVYLADNLTNIDRLLLYLLQNDNISLSEYEDISKEDTRPFRQNSKLLTLILRKDFPINTFLEILRSTQNERCANKIEGISLEAERQLQKPKILRNLWWQKKHPLIKSLYRRKVGDKLLVEELHDKISRDENRMVILCESADASKLTGMGGVGKTTTATWYAHEYEKEYDHVVWINSGEVSLQTSFKKLARDLKIEDRNEFLDMEDYSEKSYENLEEFKCLWIFDNAENCKGGEGIRDILPNYKGNFYCLITSRRRDWRTSNIGHISRLELSVFGEMESLEFFKQYLKQGMYTDQQLKELCRLLGYVPLAMQLALAALNSGNINLKTYIEKTSTSIVDTKFDDHEKTINASVNIILDLISKEESGAFVKEVLNVFGYIRPDNVEKDFLTTTFNCNSHLAILGMTTTMELLTRYSLITQDVDEQSSEKSEDQERKDSESEESETKNSESKESKIDDGEKLTFVSIHRLLQQIIRQNGRNTENDTLRKILGCPGFGDYKLLPFTTYADDELRKEFPKVKAELLDQQQLVKLLEEKRLDESVQLAKLIDNELQKNETKFNYAMCLGKNGQWEDQIKVLEELYIQDIREKVDCEYIVEVGLLKLETEVTKDLVGGHLLVSHWKMNNKDRLQEILEERKSFKMIPSQEMTSTLLKILNSNLINSNYALTFKRSMYQLVLGGIGKKIQLIGYVDMSLYLPIDLQDLILTEVGFKGGNAKTINMIDISDWLPKRLNKLEIFKCQSMNKTIFSLKSLSSDENITLEKCSLSLDSINGISTRKLELRNVSFWKNDQELSNVNVNEYIDFQKLNRLELEYSDKSNVSIDLSEESANIEYLSLNGLTVVNLKSANGRVNIKEAKIWNCSLDLSILPSSLEILSISYKTKVSTRGRIELPNLKYLKFICGNTSYLPHFSSLQLTHLRLYMVNEVNVDTVPQSIKIIVIQNKGGTRLTGGVILLEKLTLNEFSLTEVEEMSPHFHLKQLVLNKHLGYKPSDMIPLMQNKLYRLISAIAVRVDWRDEDFKNSILSKQVDRQSKYYLFHEGTGKAIEDKEFEKQYLSNLFLNCRPPQYLTLI